MCGYGFRLTICAFLLSVYPIGTSQPSLQRPQQCEDQPSCYDHQHSRQFPITEPVRFGEFHDRLKNSFATGFPPGSTLELILNGVQTEWFQRKYGECFHSEPPENHFKCIWLEARNETNAAQQSSTNNLDDEDMEFGMNTEEMSLAYIFLRCHEEDNQPEYCPGACRYGSPCQIENVVDDVCTTANTGFWATDYSCTCETGYVFSSSSHTCESSWWGWSLWSVCSQSCGGGIQDRARRCRIDSPSGAEVTCVGASQERRWCGMESCLVETMRRRRRRRRELPRTQALLSLIHEHEHLPEHGNQDGSDNVESPMVARSMEAAIMASHQGSIGQEADEEDYPVIGDSDPGYMGGFDTMEDLSGEEQEEVKKSGILIVIIALPVTIVVICCLSLIIWAFCYT